MNKSDEIALMDSLTQKQRDDIARIILSADAKGDYFMDDEGGSFWGESVSETLDCLARSFSLYDPESVLD